MAGCTGARFVRWHFTAAADALAASRTLTLRVRYTHGFAAYLDGTEIARRRLDAGAGPEALATDVHGLEFESFALAARGLLHAGPNVLAIEVHPHTAGRATSLEASLAGDEGPRFIRGPYLLGVRENEATIVVDTDLPTTVALTWGARADYGSTVTDTLGIHHVLKLTKLKPGTVYHYRIRAQMTENAQSHNENAQLHNENTQSHRESNQTRDGNTQSRNNAAASPSKNAQLHHDIVRSRNETDESAAVVDSGDVAFHTLPEAGRPLRFAVYGDVRSGHDIHAELNRSLIEEQPDLAILTGDLVDRGTDEGEWESFFDIAGPLLRQVCIFPAIGNHEYAKQGHGLAAFMQFFRWPIAGDDEPSWYSYDVAGAHFVALDSDQYKSPRQLGWFEHDLKEARRRRVRAIFVYAHEGPASSGLHGDNPICVRDYVPIMQRYRVSMFFGGHDHDYERGRIGTLDYVVTGGGGAELRAARCGVPGKRPCPARCAIFVNDHNYVMVELLPSLFRVCPKR
ncbi:MAG TPA: metallophosphoesterase family protein, partial [Polyangia bacterium]|nr:metallophosphoesterase family protein [Polyangia bacterium]